jgi:aspartyl-tRNA(Asn)/glutamyl-tRNA(Gln) amidotransferase subunit A
MLRGRSLGAVEHARAVHVRVRWQRALARIFDTVDVLATPTTVGGVPPIDDGRSLLEATDAGTRNTFPSALAEIPALSLPCGFDPDGMPIGLQLIGRWWDEPLLLRLGHAYQQRTDWHLREPAPRE